MHAFSGNHEMRNMSAHMEHHYIVALYCYYCGLDYVWPYLAGYPANKIYVINDIWGKNTLLHDAGCGLDYIWPYMAGYPADKVGVIDDICAMRPVNLLGPSVLTKVNPALCFMTCS